MEVRGAKMPSTGSGQFAPGLGKRRRSIAIVAIMMAVSMIFAGVVLSTTSIPVQVNFKDGDYFHYSLTGRLDTTTFSDDLNFTVVHADSSGMEWIGQLDMGRVDTGDFGPFPTSNVHPWQWAGNEMISTPLGEKCVKVMWNYEMARDQLFILNIGVDSSFPYRELMTNATSSDHYCIEMVRTNNSDLARADQIMRSADIKGSLKLSEGQAIPYMWSGFSEDTGVNACGSIEATAGQQLRYHATGNNTMVWVFELSDLQSTERTGAFFFNTSLSKPAGVTRDVNVTVGAGTYWYFAALRGQEGIFLNNFKL